MINNENCVGIVFKKYWDNPGWGRFNLALKCNEQSITIGGQPGNCEGDLNISYIGSMI